MIINISNEFCSNWGVYKITNIKNGDFYIGSTTESFKKRVVYKHTSDYILWKNGGKRRSMCPILYNAFKKYGIDNFEVSILKRFERKSNSKRNKKIVTYLEEKLIKELEPRYNICKYPTLSGCPNLGRKLTKEWKEKIGEKSKLYRHSDNEEVFLKKSQQNKNLSSIYRIWNDKGEEFTGSVVDCSKFLHLHQGTIMKWVTGECMSKDGWKVEVLKRQKKKVELFIDDEWKRFDSFGECDRYIKMWRGYTSTCFVNNKKEIFNYKYRIL